MNLEDVVDPEYGLQQDEWGLSRPKFGKEGQVEVVGWSGKSGTHKHYIIKCSKCSQDTELFGDGYFRSEKGSLVRGCVPCGCAFNPKWSKDQYTVLCSRKATQLGYTFLGFVGEWKGQTTKIKMLCEKHGEWATGTINTLTCSGAGCSMCGFDITAQAITKPDGIMIKSFFASGSFHPDTKFWRSERTTKQGYKGYWHMSCPECGETGDATCTNLQKGARPCGCSKQRQRQCYINWVIDACDNPVAIKFGIARDSERRLKQQDRASAYTVKSHSVYHFASVTQTKKAERECKQELECGVIPKRDMPDGWTETTWVYNLEKIEDAYKRNGGVRE